MPAIRCSCGRVMEVDPADAGQRFACECGELITAPSLSRLKESVEPIDVAPVPVAGDEETEQDFVMFLTSMQGRISHDALTNYLAACDRTFKNWQASLQRSKGFDVQLAVALLPNDQRFVDVAALPAADRTDALADLSARVEALSVPDVIDGPVAFVLRRRIFEGAPSPPVFDFPFDEQLQGEGYLDDLLMNAAGIPDFAPPKPRQSWWVRIRTFLANLTPSAPKRSAASAHRSLTELAGRHNKQEDRRPPVELEGIPEAELNLQEGRFDEAIEQCTRRLHMNPRNAQALFLRGIAYSSSGNLQHGLSDISQALERFPANAAYRVGRADIYYELGAFAQAEADLNTAIESDPREPSVFVRRAHCRLMQDRPNEAMGDVCETLRLDPHHENGFVMRGLLHLNAADAGVQCAERAEADFTSALEISPEDPVHRVQRSRALMMQGKYESAIADCDRAISVDEKCGMAYGVRGHAEQQLERYDETIADCTRAIELGFRSTFVYVSRAVGYHAQDETELAIRDCDAALELEPDSAIALNYRGVLHMSQGDVDAATADFTEAGRLAPDWSMPRGMLANTHRLQSEYDEAIEDYSRTIELDPTDLAARVNRALCWIDVGKLENAHADLSEVIALDPDLSAAYIYRAQLYLHEEREDAALADLNAAIDVEPDLAVAYHLRAQLFQSLGRMDEAIRDYNRLIELSPDSPDAFVGRANAWMEMGNDAKVADDYREAMELDPESAESLVLHRLLVEANHLHQRGEYGQAIARANEALEQDPECTPAFAIRASSYWSTEDWVEAIEDYNSVLELDADNPWALAARGQVLAEMGEFNAALKDLNGALEKVQDDDPPDQLAQVLDGRGLAFVGLQQFDEAERDFNRSIELAPNNASVHYNRGLLLREQGRIEDARRAFQCALECGDPSLTRRKRDRAHAFLKG